MRLPAGERRFQRIDQVRPHVQPAVARPAAEPLDGAADREVDSELADADRDDAGGLVAVEHDARAGLVRARDDRGGVLDLRRFVEHVGDRNEQRPLVDRFENLLGAFADDDLEIGLRLVQVANRGEVLGLVDDAVALRVDGAEAREDDRLGDGHVLVHHGRARLGADDPADLVADLERHRPPALGPGADASRPPDTGELGDAILGLGGHRAERVVDQIRRLGEDRKPIPVGGGEVHFLRLP